MACLDRHGLPLSTSSETAAAAYRDGVDRMLAAWPGAGEALDKAIAADPDFGLAHAARARKHFLYACAPAAKAKIGAVRTLVERNGTAREKSHIEILTLGMEGQSAAEGHAGAFGGLAARCLQSLLAAGRVRSVRLLRHDRSRPGPRRSVRAPRPPLWRRLVVPDLPRLVVHRERQRRCRPPAPQRGFERRRENANAAHALAHAMFEDGSTEDAEALMLALEQGDAARAVAIYAERIQPKVSAPPPINVVTDGAALLWRLVLYGHAVQKDVWDDAAAYAGRAFPRAGVTFADVHMAMVAAAIGDRAALDQRIEALETRVKGGKLAAGPVVPAICRAARAFIDGNYQGCVRILEVHRYCHATLLECPRFVRMRRQDLGFRPKRPAAQVGGSTVSKIAASAGISRAGHQSGKPGLSHQ